ncbi:hypothetical protein L596_002153 [Steinernema carpocapsae]|uniref:Plasminogen receptor (KT) n=1 Tax=Steinernema carpocapsae TaxID=34508 RepID=A0A4U8UNR2_STECR|nr:hypothetical protein L596_002153 [Steinernema carpocapsae]
MGSSQSVTSSPNLLSAAKLKELYNERMEEEIALRTMQLEQEEAVKLAHRRDQLTWEVLGTATTVVALTAAARFIQNKLIIVPMVPLIMGVGYRYEQCYGEYAANIRAKASEILHKECEVLRLPGQQITLAELDSRRNVQLREINLP